MKKVLKLFIIILFVYCFFFTTRSFANEVIYINSVSDYISFSQNCEASNGYDGMKIVLTCDLDFENQLTPMVKGIFKGVFDGQGHRFKNIKLENSENKYSEIGLFEENYGIIKKVVVESGTITGNFKTGAICATNSGIVEQCANFVDISSAYVIGGIVGWNEGQGIVRNCYNVGNISDKQPGSGGTIGFGGIVGYLYSGTILDSYNVGVIAPERTSCKGNIIGTYYSPSSDSEFIDNCFSLLLNTEQSANNEIKYCIPLIEFNEKFYSNLTDPNYFYNDNSDYPHINMDIDLNTLPTLVTLPSNFEKNPIFDNFYELVNNSNDNNLETNIIDNSENSTIEEDIDNTLAEFQEDIFITSTTDNPLEEHNYNLVHDLKNAISDLEENQKKETQNNFFETFSFSTIFILVVLIILIVISIITSSSPKKLNDDDDPINTK